MGNERFIREELKRLEQRAKKVVEETKALVLSLNLNGTVTKEQGPIAPTLLKRALKRDGLVMGSRGLDALDRFMLGSVPTRVTLHASCSILVVKEQPRPLRRILPSTDGSKPSEKAFQFTLTKLRADGRGSDGGEPLAGRSQLYCFVFLRISSDPHLQRPSPFTISRIRGFC